MSFWRSLGLRGMWITSNETKKVSVESILNKTCNVLDGNWRRLTSRIISLMIAPRFVRTVQLNFAPTPG